MATPYSVEEVKLEDGSKGVWLRDHGESGLQALITEQGGELASLKVKSNDRFLELLHGAVGHENTTDWRGRAPVLFPAVGRNFTAEQTATATEAPAVCQYQFEGETRDIGLHGFAMSMKFTIVSTGTEDGASCTVMLSDDMLDAATRASYPFKFTLRITYTVADGQLTARHEVNKPDDAGKTPFSIGNHITIAFPFADGQAWEDGELSGSVDTEYCLNSMSLLTGETKPFSESGALPLSDARSCNMVAGWKEAPSTASMRLSTPGGPSISVSQTIKSSEFASAMKDSYFVFWGEPPKEGSSCGFHCVEPWVGGPNSLNTGKGLIVLTKDAPSFVWEMAVKPQGF